MSRSHFTQPKTELYMLKSRGTNRVFVSSILIDVLYTFNGSVCAGSCDGSSRTCTVSAWCPVETDLLPLGEDRAVLEQVDNFTLLIKNQIYFPKFDKKRSNILQAQNDSYLKSCRNVYGCYSLARQKVCRCDSDRQVAAEMIRLLKSDR